MSFYRPHLMTKVESDHVMKAMKGQACRLRVSSLFPGHTCADDSTTVGCHLIGGGKGVSTKETDLAVAAGCKHCHDIVDGVDWKRLEFIIENYPAAYGDRLLKGLIETHAMLVDEGLLIVSGGKIIRSI